MPSHDEKTKMLTSIKFTLRVATTEGILDFEFQILVYYSFYAHTEIVISRLATFLVVNILVAFVITRHHEVVSTRY